MKYTQTMTKPFKPNPLGSKLMPVFTTTNLGVGKTAPFFVSTASTTLKGNRKISYKMMENDPVEETPDIHQTPSEVTEIEDPVIGTADEDRPRHTHYDDCKNMVKKPKLRCDSDDDDEEYIEVPGGSDSVEWTDEDGQTYEVSIDDLIEYDGDDGEIQYTKGKKKNTPLVAMHHIKDNPNYYLNMIMAKQSMMHQFGVRQYNA